MELPYVGKNCSVNGCNRLDFLPLHCKCGKTFCSEHFLQHSEVCTLAEPLVIKNPEKEDEKSDIIYTCNFEGCSIVSLFHFPCKKCHQHYCINHRHHKSCDISEKELEEEQKRWNLPVEQYNIAKEKLDIQLNKNAMKMAPDSKKSKMSNKIQLMRLKGKAVGQKDVPTQDRLYFLIYKPIGMVPKQIVEHSDKNLKLSDTASKIDSVAVYVSKNWSIGKVIDSVSQLCKVINNNNKANESKLRLFRALDGLIISSVMNTKINDVLGTNIIRDGESLILEYIENDKYSLADCYLQQYAIYSE